MALTSLWIAIAGTLAASGTSSLASDPGPLKVTTQVAPGVHFVGQAIEITAEVEGARSSIGFEAPRMAAGEITTLVGDPSKPTLGRFLVIPNRSGTLEIPPFRARSGQQSGTGRPTRLVVSPLPAEGRTAAFLGGVGGFEVKAETEPTTLRAGQTLEFRVRITGVAAWGSDRPPDLSSWQPLGGGLRIELLTNLMESLDPPIRVFRYQIRTQAPGRLVLPPVSVASFEPKGRRFVTRTTSSVPVVVEKPPRLDPNTLDYRPVRVRDPWLGLVTVGLGLSIATVATLALWYLARRKRRPRAADPVRLAVDLGRSLHQQSEVEPARRVAEALTTYLERVDGRSPGVLTPPEALEAFGRILADDALAERARGLVVACDRSRYRDRFRDAEGLVDAGRLFFEEVAAVMGRKQREGGGPREAVETA